jgi:hypothetical protein
MKSAIKAVDSSLRLILTVLQLVISTAFLLKVFGEDNFAEGGTVDYVLAILQFSEGESALDSATVAVAGPATFLILVLGFMFFCLIICRLAPYMLEKQGRRKNRFY